MTNLRKGVRRLTSRRSFLTKGLVAAGAVTTTSRMLAGPEARSGRLTRGDAAILRFLAAAEIIETDFWVQYNELAGVQDAEVPGGTGSPIYTAKLRNLDEDMDQ